MKALPRSRAEAQRTFVSFFVSEIAYALDVVYVVQIVHPGPVDPLPYMPHGVIGVSDFRGKVIPIIDLRVRLGASPARDERKVKWLVVKSGPAMGALVVDDVEDVFSVLLTEIRPPPRSGDEEMRALGGVFQHRKRMTFVLDLLRLQSLLEVTEHQPSEAQDPAGLRDEGRKKGRT
ncbi:MAG: chemotaxis protein CheW [Myxococcales bacterium]|nr:chemotaxis protein CheW [Polyangiaceae bacterium]MDW8248476.1 chemotaxis protein CheW [Myxococcales bacterium]